MPLTKSDLNDATLLLKAGNTDAVRRILVGSNDPRAIAILKKLDARFSLESQHAPAPQDDLSEIKRLLMQKKFNEAETLLRASHHPKAKRLLQRIARMKASAQPMEKAKPRPRSLWKYIAVTLYGFISSSS
jgi:hypothetical protein